MAFIGVVMAGVSPLAIITILFSTTLGITPICLVVRDIMGTLAIMVTTLTGRGIIMDITRDIMETMATMVVAIGEELEAVT